MAGIKTKLLFLLVVSAIVATSCRDNCPIEPRHRLLAPVTYTPHSDSISINDSLIISFGTEKALYDTFSKRMIDIDSFSLHHFYWVIRLTEPTSIGSQPPANYNQFTINCLQGTQTAIDQVLPDTSHPDSIRFKTSISFLDTGLYLIRIPHIYVDDPVRQGLSAEHEFSFLYEEENGCEHYGWIAFTPGDGTLPNDDYNNFEMYWNSDVYDTVSANRIQENTTYRKVANANYTSYYIYVTP